MQREIKLVACTFSKTSRMQFDQKSRKLEGLVATISLFQTLKTRFLYASMGDDLCTNGLFPMAFVFFFQRIKWMSSKINNIPPNEGIYSEKFQPVVSHRGTLRKVHT
jgi:hypothetical protein